MPGIISPADSRRTSDESEPVRQSLPSISEVISGTKPAASSAYPPNIPTSMSGGHNLPSPFATSAPSRPFADISSQDRQHNSPRMPHGTAPYPPREHLPPFPDPSRGPLTTRPPPPPPVNTYNGIHPSTPMKLESHGVERQREEHHHMNGSYPQPPRESSQLPYPQPGHLPPGQVPLPAHPMSPRYVGPSLPSPFDGSRSSAHEDEFRRSGNKYEQTVNRYHEAWGYAESLAKVCIFGHVDGELDTDFPYRSPLVRGPSSTSPTSTGESHLRSKALTRCRDGYPPSAKSATCST